MKIAVAFAFAVLAFASGASADKPVACSNCRIHVGAQIGPIHVVDHPPFGPSTGDLKVEFVRLWGRNYGHPIGNGLLIFTFAGQGGVLGEGQWQGQGTFTIGNRRMGGKIVVAGALRNQRRFWLPIVGGSRLYRHAVGSLHATPSDPGHLNFDFFLQ